MSEVDDSERACEDQEASTFAPEMEGAVLLNLMARAALVPYKIEVGDTW